MAWTRGLQVPLASSDSGATRLEPLTQQSEKHSGGTQAVASGKSPIEPGVRFLKDGRLMVVILRDLKTGLYFGGENAWVGKPEEATDFGTLEAAGRGAWECVGEDVAVVLRYDNPECELALNPAFCMSTSSARARLGF